MNIEPGYTFDDLLLKPKHSTIKSRKVEAGDIDTSVDLGKGIKLKIPIISANMKNVTEQDMANMLAEMGGMPILHRFCSIEENLLMYKHCDWETTACSVGVSHEDKIRADKIISTGCSVLCIDVAHGDHAMVIDTVEHYAKTFPEVLLIAGNVATGAGALRLYNAGADVIKVGIGPGSLCTTRIETGNGVPQMTALENVFMASCEVMWDEETQSRHNPFDSHFRDKSNRKFKIIADGGIRNGGDIIKALCFSDAVMLGSLLAGTDEAPGKTIRVNGLFHKRYDGSSTHKSSNIEGVKALVQCKGPAKDIIDRLLGGLRSGLSYQGSKNLEILKENPEFYQITNAGLIESHPHDVVIR